MKKIDNKQFYYRICPGFGKVHAEIYYTIHVHEVMVLSKSFGGFLEK